MQILLDPAISRFLLPYRLMALGLEVDFVLARSGLTVPSKQPQPGARLPTALAASASYAPVSAVLHFLMPDVNPSLHFAQSLGVTFAMNILPGMPLYAQAAQQMLG